MAIITKSIGTTGRDHATITLWEAAAYGATGSDNAVGEVYDDGAIDERPVINDSTPIDITITVPSAERHDGTAGSGALLKTTAAGVFFFQTNITIPFDLEWLEFDANAQSTRRGVSLDGNVNQNAQRVILHNLTRTGADIKALTTGPTTGNVSDCIVYDISVTGGAADCRGITADPVAASFLNNTVYNITNNGSGVAYGIDLPDTSGAILRNNISMGTGGSGGGTHADFGVSSYSNATVSNNLSSDTSASGSGSLISKIASSQFISTTNDFHLKTGADAIGAGLDLGTSPPGVEIDIDGTDRDAQGDAWDIGAHQLVVSPTVFPLTQVLSLVQPIPIIGLISNIVITPSAQALSLVLEVPVIQTGVIAAVSGLSLSLAVLSPVAKSDGVITAPSQVLSLVQPIPIIDITGNVTITPSVLGLSLALNTPVIVGDVTVAPPSQVLSLVQPIPIIDITGNVTITPSVLGLSLTAFSPPFDAQEALPLVMAQHTPVVSIAVAPGIAASESLLLTPFLPNVLVSDDIKIVVTNARTFAVSEYANFAYNSMAIFNGKYLYAKADGIYEGGGDNDNGADIAAGYKTGTFDINATEVQKLRNVWMNYRSDGDIKLFSVGNEVNARWYPFVNSTNGTMHERRQKFERGIKDNHFSFGISNVAGSSFEIKTAKILTEPIRKRR